MSLDDTAAAPQLPPFRTRVMNFMHALAGHVRNGFTTVSPEVLEQRLETCASCQHFTGQHCAKCGCNCGNRNPFLNKLAWESEHCPLDPPKW